MSAPRGAPNRLAQESSPYLLLHAYNPVDWYPWGDAAFERARAEDKPIFLSVGYSTCHWCHVMEHESFSNEEIARQLNDGFVCLKVDREERPDLDEIYMLATQLMTQQGGWPNSVFLTHDLKPFFAGTYFPPDDRWGRPGFPRLLTAIHEAWTERRESVLEQAEELAQAIRAQLAETAGGALPPASVVAATQAALAKRFDAQHGGFGGAPKFPSPSNLFFLLDRADAGDEDARRMLGVTLDAMARGGIHDQLAGGFHRYSTDERWLVPHFEKMLYDNASLAVLYAEAGRSLRRSEFTRVARSTVEFCARELRLAQHIEQPHEDPIREHDGFLSAVDADTDGEEGAYYTWTAEDLRQALSAEDHALLAPIFGFDGAPNFEGGRYVLHLPVGWEERAQALGREAHGLQALAGSGVAALLAARERRVRPPTDDKVLCDWNGLMISACANVGRLLGEQTYPTARQRTYISQAEKAAEFVLRRLRSDTGGLLHAFRGRAHIEAFLDDYAFLVHGLLALFDATGAQRWLDEGVRLQAEQDRRLWDDDAGGYFQAGAHPHLLVRSKSATDGALPSGNGVAALNLIRLARITGDDALRARARRVLECFGGLVERFPLGHVTLVQALARLGESGAPDDDRPPARRNVLEALVEDVVRVTATTLDASAPRTRVRVELHIAAGWHVNSYAVGEPYLVPTRVDGPRLKSVRYPPPTRHAAGDVYRDDVAIEVELHAADGPSSLDVTFQPCDDQRCLPPATWKLSEDAQGAWEVRRSYLPAH